MNTRPSSEWNTLEAGEKLNGDIYHKLVYGKSRNTIFHLEVALPGGSVFFELSGQKNEPHQLYVNNEKTK